MALLRWLLPRFDVFVENFRIGVMDGTHDEVADLAARRFVDLRDVPAG